MTVEQFRDFLRALARRRAGPRGDRRRRDAGAGRRGRAPHDRRLARAARAAGRRPMPRALRPPAPAAEPRALHPPRRSRPGLCADRLVDLRRQRPAARAAGAGARRQHLRDAAVRPAARGGGRDLFARRLASHRRGLSAAGACSPPRPRSGPPTRRPSSASPARSSPISPATPATREEFARAQNPVISGIERLLATNAYWVSALENWHRDPRDIENVRHYLADYRALTPEDVRRAVAAHVTEQGDWSMLVLPSRESRRQERRMASNSAIPIAEAAAAAAAGAAAELEPVHARRPALLRRQEPRLLDAAVDRLGRLFLPAHALQHRQCARMEHGAVEPCRFTMRC